MKKVITLFLACVICAVMMPVASFAETQTDENLFGVIVNAEGNVVEVLRVPRTTYVNSVYTIPAGGMFISYQYEADDLFTFVCKKYDTNGNTITTPGFDLTMWIEQSNTIGGGGRGGLGTPFKDGTNTEKALSVNAKSSGYKYFNGKVENNSSKDTKVRVIIVVDDVNVPY